MIRVFISSVQAGDMTIRKKETNIAHGNESNPENAGANAGVNAGVKHSIIR